MNKRICSVDWILSGKFLLAVLSVAGCLLLCWGCSSAPKDGSQKSIIAKGIAKAHDFMEQGNGQFSAGLYPNAYTSYRAANNLYSSLGDKKGTISSFVSISQALLRQGDRRQGLKVLLFVSHYASLNVEEDPVSYRKTLNYLADFHLTNSNYEKVLELCDVELIPNLPRKTEETGTMYRLQGVAYKRKGEVELARKNLNMALNIDLSIKNKINIAADYYTLSSLASLSGDYGLALDLIEQALKFDKEALSREGVATDLEAMGIITEKMWRDLNEKGEVEKAQPLLEKSYYLYYQAYLAWNALGNIPRRQKIVKKILDLPIERKPVFLD